MAQDMVEKDSFGLRHGVLYRKTDLVVTADSRVSCTDGSEPLYIMLTVHDKECPGVYEGHHFMIWVRHAPEDAGGQRMYKDGHVSSCAFIYAIGTYDAPSSVIEVTEDSARLFEEVRVLGRRRIPKQ